MRKKKDRNSEKKGGGRKEKENVLNESLYQKKYMLFTAFQGAMSLNYTWELIKVSTYIFLYQQ